MPLTTLDPTPGADKWNAQGYPKLNAAINKVNEIDANITGGTTGQVLKKSSNSNYAYTWGAEQSITGKADKTQLLMVSTAGSGPTSYSTETTIASFTPSASLGSTKMKFTFQGYLSNNIADTATIRIYNNGTLIGRTIVTVPNGQINFCVICYNSYVANDVTHATVQCTSDGGEVSDFTLSAETFNAQ